jgi:hypothetical protein
MMQLITHRLYNLPQASHPATQPFRPGLAVVPLRRTDYPGPIVVVTMLMPCFPLKSLVHYVIARGWATHCRHPGVRAVPEGQEILGQCLVFGTGWGKAEASDDSLGVDREQHMEPFIPAQAVAPANIRLTGQPTSTPALGISGGNPSAIQSLVGSFLSLERSHQKMKESDDGLIMPPHQAVELASVGQGGESRAQVFIGVAVEAPFAGEMVSLAEESQGNHFTPRQGSPRARDLLWGQLVFAEIISHNIKVC